MKLIHVVALSFVLTGCMATYRDFPVDAIGKKPTAGTCDVMHYNIKRFEILDMGGYNRLNEVFKNAGICKKMVIAETAPEKGLYLEVETKWQTYDDAALIFGYISVSTLTLLPAWSMHDGYIVKYNIYVDGQKKEAYTYEITRKAGIWLGLLPFAWINLFTYNEEDAFEATAYQFAADAQAYFGSQPPLKDAKP